jgi:hypothetical protein
LTGRAYRESCEALQEQFSRSSYRSSVLKSTEWRVDEIVASSSSTASTPAPVPVINVKMVIDTRPNASQAVSLTSTLAASSSIHEIGFEICPDKLDVLIHELSTAYASMKELQS